MTPGHISLLVALCSSHLLVGWWTWWRMSRGGRTLSLAQVAGGVLVMAVFSLAQLFVFKGRLLSTSAVMNVAWLDLTVVTPLAGIGLLLAGRRGWSLSRAARGAAWLSLATIPLAVYAQAIEPFRLSLEQVDVSLASARSGREPITLGVLADLQFSRITDHEIDAVERLMALQPDVVLIPGDLFEGTAAGFESELPRIQSLLARLSAPGGVWLVTGDVDVHDGFERVTDGTSVRLLRDELVEIIVRDRQLTLLGIDRHGWVEGAREALAALEERPGETDVRLVLAHRPIVIEQLQPGTRVDLIVAGHTHGGQVALPFLGPPYIGSPLPNHVGAGGLHVLDGRRIYISRGIGMERHQSPRIRFLVPPEISLLTLR